ncbi:hypothetical protein [Pseudalkalibacillus sp. JSM 102089]|uniref:hypothetical protein n=1 Tax=Pseudalkalibacillus sp. JSM 102089 TaxID=3229856 RepID=UPI0035239C29
MLTAKRDIMKNVPNPETYTCVCGRQAQLTDKNITTKFKDQTIVVNNVPSYECSSGHVKLSRLTRVNIKKLLKTAYENGLNSINYK